MYGDVVVSVNLYALDFCRGWYGGGVEYCVFE